jgi:hypothetical protein
MDQAFLDFAERCVADSELETKIIPLSRRPLLKQPQADLTANLRFIIDTEEPDKPAVLGAGINSATLRQIVGDLKVAKDFRGIIAAERSMPSSVCRASVYSCFVAT